MAEPTPEQAKMLALAERAWGPNWFDYLPTPMPVGAEDSHAVCRYVMGHARAEIHDLRAQLRSARHKVKTTRKARDRKDDSLRTVVGQRDDARRALSDLIEAIDNEGYGGWADDLRERHANHLR